MLVTPEMIAMYLIPGAIAAYFVTSETTITATWNRMDMVFLTMLAAFSWPVLVLYVIAITIRVSVFGKRD